MLAAAGAISVIIALYFKDWLYPLVIIWRLFAIYTEHDSEYTSLNITLLFISIVLAVSSLVVIVMKNTNKGRV